MIVVAMTSSLLKFVMRYLEIQSSRLTAKKNERLVSCSLRVDKGVNKRRGLTVTATDAALAGESRSTVQDAPVVKDWMRKLANQSCRAWETRHVV